MYKLFTSTTVKNNTGSFLRFKMVSSFKRQVAAWTNLCSLWCMLILVFLIRNLNLNSFGHSEHLVCIFLCITNTVWKVSKYRVFSGPYFPAFRLNTICKCLLIFGRCFIFWNIFHGQNDHFELYILSLVSSDNNFLGAWTTVAISSYLNDFAGIITIYF